MKQLLFKYEVVCKWKSQNGDWLSTVIGLFIKKCDAELFVEAQRKLAEKNPMKMKFSVRKTGGKKWNGLVA